MRAGEILLARHAHLRRGTDERVPDQQVQTLAQRLVEGGLEVVPERLLPVRADGGEAFGQHEPAAVGVRGGGGLLDEEAVGVADAMPPGPGPELGHRHVVETQAALGVDRHRVRPAGFGMDLQAVPVRPVAERAVMVVDREVAEGLAEIVQEPVADRAAVDDAAGHHRQERQQIVAAALAELLAQRGRPVDGLHLPAVGVQILERAAGQRPGVGDQRLDHRVPVALERAGVEHVQRVAFPAVAGGRDAGVVADGAAEPQDLPGACGHLPAQHAVLGSLAVRSTTSAARVSSSPASAGTSSNSGVVSGAEKCSALCMAFCSQFWIGLTRRLGPRSRPALLEPVGHHGNSRGRSRRGSWAAARPDRASPGRSTMRLGPDQLLGGVLGRDHRAAEIPAALDVQAHLQSQPVGLAQGVLVKLAPLGREESRAVRHAVVAVLLAPPASQISAPPKPLAFISSRSRVMAALVTLPFSHHQ